MRLLLTCCLFLLFARAGADTTHVQRVFTFDLKDEIGPSSSRIVKKAFDQAYTWKADLILIHMNTYGGLLDHADSIRTRVLQSSIPVYVFIDNNAASAGALISIACNKIYMRMGANIGAASVVTETGELAPDKYQSYMRSMMRSTAETRGRNPQIAEAMVDGKIVVPGVNKEGQVITFTATEALKNGYCEAICENQREVMKAAGIGKYETKELELSAVDGIIGFLVNPAISGVLILLILAGIYYELQAPGIGFPSAIAIAAALLYFAPLYLEGLALNWEILIFIMGLLLVALEIFVIPGFGVAGISGILLVVAGLVLSLVRNVDFDFTLTGEYNLTHGLSVVFMSLCCFVIFLFFFGTSVMKSPYFKRLVLEGTLADSKVPVVHAHTQTLEGQSGTALSDLRPQGKISLNGKTYTAQSMGEYISKGTIVNVISDSNGKIIVKAV